MERKSKTTRNHTRVNNLTMISLSRSLMKHVIYINSEKLPGKSRPRSIPSLIKRDILRRKRYLVSDMISVWPLDGDQVFCNGISFQFALSKSQYFFNTLDYTMQICIILQPPAWQE